MKAVAPTKRGSRKINRGQKKKQVCALGRANEGGGADIPRRCGRGTGRIMRERWHPGRLPEAAAEIIKRFGVREGSPRSN